MRRYPVINLGQAGVDSLNSAMWSKPISDDLRPKEIPAECKFLGYLYDAPGLPGSASAEANLEAKTNLILAQQAGYTDIKYAADTMVGLLRPEARKMVWACPVKSLPPPTGPASKYEQPQPAQAVTSPAQTANAASPPLPQAPAPAKSDLLPIVAGVGVVSIFVAFISGAFGK